MSFNCKCSPRSRLLASCSAFAGFLVLLGATPRVTQTAIAQESTADTSEQAADGGTDPAAKEAIELPVRLLDREPFDRITLNTENGNAVIETVLLDLPDRRVPDPKPDNGSLTLRRLSEPSIPYEVNWSEIEKVEFYETMLLAEAERLTAAAQFDEAFEYLAFLSSNYPQLPGLEVALQSHLWREASTAFAAGDRDQAWPALHALYLRNPQFPRLANAVQAVSDDMISLRLKQQNYAAARAMLNMLEQTFPNLPLGNIARWRGQFEADARAQLEKARAALAAGEYSEARAAVTHARSILPTIEGGEELWKEIQGTAPEIRVGVMQAAPAPDRSKALTWAAARIAGLVNPTLIKTVDFGAEGGVYASDWCAVSTSDDGLATTVQLSPSAAGRGLTPDVVALGLAEMASVGGEQAVDDFAALVDRIGIGDGQRVTIHWRRPHVRPESFLQVPLRRLAWHSRGSGLWFEPVGQPENTNEQRYERTGPPNSNEARFIVEQVFASDDAALEALLRGDVDVVDRVPPWQLERMQQAEGIIVKPYRLPTVHVLVPNVTNPIVEARDFRRAICYGVDADSIVRDILLAGAQQPGYRTLSGPFPAGASQSDPVGYAYNSSIAPRPYEPRLAALLANVARQAVAKREAEAKKAKQAAKDVVNEGAVEADAEGPQVEGAEAKADGQAAPQPLILAHSSDPLARLACQSIKIQLDGVGIPIKLLEVLDEAPAAGQKYDLLYAEVAVWEPVVDARRLFGRNGLTGRTGPLMALALDQVAKSENWNQARAQLNEIHRIAHHDLPVIPLWQTVNFFAHRQSIEGITETPVSLYQDLSQWRKLFE
jgi:tetratricopeptide (TPR) repeat protein